MESKFYWLKLKKDFFKRHDIRIIESMPNGIEISHFYVKLMLESVDHDGELRLNEEDPYTPEMLAVVTNTELDIVNKAFDVLKKFKLVEIAPDGTIILRKVKTMIDSASDSDGARRMRRLREQRANNLCEQANKTCEQNEQERTKRNESKSKSKEIDIKRNTKEKRFSVPTLEEVSSYCQERNNGVDAERFINYYESKGWKVGSSPMKDWRAAVRTWEKNYTAKPCEPTASKYDINWDEV